MGRSRQLQGGGHRRRAARGFERTFRATARLNIAASIAVARPSARRYAAEESQP